MTATTAAAAMAARIAENCSQAKATSTGWQACCPAHEDSHPSLSIGYEGDKVLLHCHAGCSVESICAALMMTVAQLFCGEKKKRRGTAQFVEAYDYVDEHGTLLFQVRRFSDKTFPQRRPDPTKPGAWIPDIQGVRRVLYRLPQLLAAIAAGQPIYLPEGEKDVHTLERLGLVAACNPMGAATTKGKETAKWLPEYSKMLRGAQVVLLPDHDQQGANHVAMVSSKLHGIATSVKIVPGIHTAKAGSDVTDWVAAGGTREQLEAAVAACPLWTPQSVPAEDSGTLEAEPDDEPVQESEGPRPSQATRLVELVLDAGAVLFHTPDGEAYGSLPRDGHTETYPLKVRSFRRWMARLYYDKEGKSPGSQAVQDALAVLEGKAQFDGEELQVYVRLAEHDGKFYLDLANKDWQAVEVTTAGWTVVTTCPVKFRRMPGMVPLPVPAPGGTLGQLRKLLNLNQDGQENAWRLVVHWLLANLSPRGPYPILVLHGGHGSGKTTLVRVLRSCVDPNTAPLRRPPRDDQNVAIAASNSWVVAYDNLSHLPDWLSDVLCCVATGLGFATRSLYTDGEEALFQAMRPVVVNGIEELASRADFLDRSIIVHLPAMQTVQDEQTFWAAVDTARPKILGALLGIVSAGLKALPTTKLTDAPRMADFARWSCACAAACGWTADEFLTAYKDVRENTHMLTLEASLLWPPLQTFMEDWAKRTPTKEKPKGAPWTGSTTELLAGLATRADEETRRNKGWPKKPNVFSNDLRRLVPTLKAVGMTVKMTRDREGSHIEILEWVGKTSSPSSPSSPASNDAPF